MPVVQRLGAFAGFVVVVLAALVTLGAWAVSSPAGSSPDDNYHLSTIWCGSQSGAEECTFSSQGIGFANYRIESFPEPCYQFRSDVSGSCVELGTGEWRVNENHYPGLFYEFSALFAGDDPAEVHTRTRLAVVVSVVAVLAAAYLVALPWLRPAMLVSWVAVAAPGLMSWVASNNPSSWGIVGMAAAWGPMITAYLATSVARQVSAAAVFLLAGTMAAGARADTGIYFALMALAGIGLFLILPSKGPLPATTLRERFRSGWPGLVGSVMVLVIAGLFVAGSGQFGGAAEGLIDDVGTPTSTDAILWSLVLALPVLTAGLWGMPGGVYGQNAATFSWFDVPMPPTAWITVLMAVGALLLAGLGIMFARKALALIALAAVIVVVPSQSLLRDGVIVGNLFQARYVAPLVTVFVGVALIPSVRQRIRLNGTQAIVLGIAFAIAGALGLHAWIRRFVTGTDVISHDLTENAEWWEFALATPNQVWIAGSVAWVVLVAAAVSSLYAGRRATRGPDGAQLTS